MWFDPLAAAMMDPGDMSSEMADMLDAARMNAQRPTARPDLAGRVEVVYEGQDWTEIPHNVTHARIHPSQKKIKDTAFNRCAQLVEVEFHDELRIIGASAFSDCTSLRRIKGGFPRSLRLIEQEAFLCCRSLTELDLPETILATNYCAFSECLGLTKIKVRIMKIGTLSFEGCRNLSEVELSNGLVEICDRAFKGCPSLKRIQVPLKTEISEGDLREGDHHFNSFDRGVVVERVEKIEPTASEEPRAQTPPSPAPQCSKNDHTESLDHKGTDKTLSNCPSQADSKVAVPSQQSFYVVRHRQGDCMPGDWDEEITDMLFAFTDAEDAMDAAKRAAEAKNEAYWRGCYANPIEEHPWGYLQKGETQNRKFEVRTINVEVAKDGGGSKKWLWAVSEGWDGVTSFFDGNSSKEAVKCLNEVVKERLSGGASSSLAYGDSLETVRLETNPCKFVRREVCLVTKINPNFEDYFDNMCSEEVREYVEDWSPQIQSTVQLVNIPIRREPLPANHFEDPSVKLWSNNLKNTEAKYEVLLRCSVDDKSQILAELNKYISKIDVEAVD